MDANQFDGFASLTPRSRDLIARARARIPGGVTSNVKFFAPYPIVMSHASGSRIVDEDGREYIDYCLAFGPLIAGHGHPRVMSAIRHELDRAGTVILGTPSRLEFELAERLAAVLPSAEMVRFTNSGTEATLHALRIARGATGRTKVVKFEGHYHGVHDSVLMNTDRPLPRAPSSDGIPPSVEAETIVLPFNDPAAFQQAMDQTDDVAAVILEPIARGAIESDPEFLRIVRDITTRKGIVLIFDEVVCWPRVGLGGAQKLYGVTPDLTALGKAIGGGLPLGAIAGRSDLMSIVTPRDAREQLGQVSDAGLASGQRHVFHGGTYNGAPVALAAGLAVLDLLEEDRNLWRLIETGHEIRNGLRDVLATADRPAQVLGVGAGFDFYFTAEPVRSSREIWSSDLEARRRLDYFLLTRGIYNSPLHRFHLSLTHSPEDIRTTLETIEAGLRHLEMAPA